MVWENRSEPSIAGHRKFYAYDDTEDSADDALKRESNQGEEKECRGEDLVKRLADQVIGKDTVYQSPFGPRQVLYLDYIASGRALSFIEEFIRDTVLPQYGSTHTTSSHTAMQTTMFRHEARDIIRSAVRAGDRDRVIFTGSGATGATALLLHSLNLTEAPVVLVGPFLHHSALLPWREGGAEVVRIRENSSGHVDLEHLEENLRKFGKGSRQVIGCFNAASNVTGIITNTVTVTSLLHKYAALAFWDYATAAPYLPVDMAQKDAVFFSLHKFLGGVQSPGVLIAKTHVFRSKVPTVPGGGSVFFVGRSQHSYLKEEENKEEAGTPAIVESIRGGLAMQLVGRVGYDTIEKLHQERIQKLATLVETTPNLVALGPSYPEGRNPRIPILSFLIKHPTTATFLHHNFVSTILNDVYGIQARGGCACAGPYSLDILGIDEDTATRYHQGLSEAPSLDRHQLRRRQETSDTEWLRPGYTRLVLPYTATEEQVTLILDALRQVAEKGWTLLPQYKVDPETAEWRHRDLPKIRRRQWLADLTIDGFRGGQGRTGLSQNAPLPHQLLKQAEEIYEAAPKKARQGPAPPSDQLLPLTEDLRWFLLPSHAAQLLKENQTPLQIPPPPFCPPTYPLSENVLRSRPDHFWKQGPRMFFWGHEDSKNTSNSLPENENNSPSNQIYRESNSPKLSDSGFNSSNRSEEDVSKIPTEINGNSSKNIFSNFENALDSNNSNEIEESISDISKSVENISLEEKTDFVCTGMACLLPRKQNGVEVNKMKEDDPQKDNKEEDNNKKKRIRWHNPPKDIMSPVIEALDRFSMLKSGDRVLVCLSGGKDSLSLLHILRQYQHQARAKGRPFELGAITVDPESESYDPRPLIPYLKDLGVHYLYEKQAILASALSLPNLTSICAYCSRLKRGRIYSAARANGYNVLAMGHHLDDLAESFLMSLLHNGRLRTMKASYTVKEGDLRVIRPLVFCRERQLREFAESRSLPIIPENCPACFQAPKERHRTKQLLAQQELLFPQVYSAIKRALLPLMSINAVGVENKLLGKGAFSLMGAPSEAGEESEEDF